LFDSILGLRVIKKKKEDSIANFALNLCAGDLPVHAGSEVPIRSCWVRGTIAFMLVSRYKF